MMTTEQMLAYMLKVKTGSAMCDSGGIPQYDETGHYTGSVQGYGRNWERNQERNFEQEPCATLWFSIDRDGKVCIDYTRSTFHYLAEALCYEPAWDRFFQTWAENSGDRAQTSYMEDVADFAAWLKEEGFEIARSPWATAKDDYVWSGNSYNEENNLDQVVQFMQLVVDEIPEKYEDADLDCAELIFLQTHQGSDVRGGYSEPHVFTEGEGRWLSFTDGTIRCASCGTYWQTDDSYDWYKSGSEMGIALTAAAINLRDCVAAKLSSYADDMPDGFHYEGMPKEQMTLLGLAALPQQPAPASDLVAWARKCFETEDGPDDVIFVDDDHNGYCPICGGLLEPVL